MTLTDYYGLTALPATAILLAGGLALLMTRRKSAQVRQFVCGATLASLLLIGVIPALPVKAQPVLPRVVAKSLPAPPRLIFAPASTEGTPFSQTQNPIAPSRLDFLMVLALAGVVISTLLALRLAGSLLAVARLRKQARPASSRIRGLAEDNVRVVESLSSPVALGGFKPVILLPAEAEDWPEDRIRAVLIHEQAHLRNGDPNWQLLAEVACLLHWFNPLAWFVRSAMRREAERAADDAVLRAGIRPSDYASELVAFAAKMGADRQPVAWTAFARKSGVSSRVRAILTPHLERKPMTKKTKLTAIASVALAAYSLSAYAFQEREASPHSPYKDVREGKTVPASPSNGFVGELADGRKVEVLQISRRMPNGSIVAWKPDGTLIPASQQVRYGYRNSLDQLDTHTRYIFVSFPEAKGGSINPIPGLGSGKHDAGSPSSLIFAGGGIISHENQSYTIVSFIGVPKEDGSNLPASFSVADGPYEDHGVIQDGAPLIRKVQIKEVARPKAEDGPAIDWAAGHSGPLTMVDFDVLCPDGDLIGDLEIKPFLMSGKELDESMSHGNYGSYIQVDESHGGPRLRSNQKSYLQQRRYFALPKSAIREFHLLTRTAKSCEIQGMALNPKGS